MPFIGASELPLEYPYPVSITRYPDGTLVLEKDTLYFPVSCLETDKTEVIDFPSHHVPLIEAPELVPLILPIASIRGCLPFAPAVTKSVCPNLPVTSHLPTIS